MEAELLWNPGIRMPPNQTEDHPAEVVNPPEPRQAPGTDGQTYNVNADLAAGAIAAALGAIKLLLLTDVAGIYRDFEDKSSLIESLTAKEAEGLIADGVVAKGMIPKVRCCVDAVRCGVGNAHIVDGRTPHAILTELFTDAGCGTMIVRDK